MKLYQVICRYKIVGQPIDAVTYPEGQFDDVQSAIQFADTAESDRYHAKGNIQPLYIAWFDTENDEVGVEVTKKALSKLLSEMENTRELKEREEDEEDHSASERSNFLKGTTL